MLSMELVVTKVVLGCSSLATTLLQPAACYKGLNSIPTGFRDRIRLLIAGPRPRLNVANYGTLRVRAITMATFATVMYLTIPSILLQYSMPIL